jgi:hypothetical protein
VSLAIMVAVVLALVSTTPTNLAYLRQHDAAADLPVLCMRRPLQSARLLLEDRSWMLGFAMESSGVLLCAAALALAPLALVQSIAAGGIGVLAFASARFVRRQLSGRELTGVVLSVTGLLALAISLAGGTNHGGGGAVTSILMLAGVTLGVAVVLVVFGRHLLGIAVADAVAGGLLFSTGDALDEGCHSGRRSSRLHRHVDRRVDGRHGTAATWLPGQRGAYRRRCRNAAD